MAAIDYGILVIYFIGIFYIGWKVSIHVKTDKDLFLANRSLGFIAIGFSLFATNISSTSLLGLASFAYSYGIAVANYEWMASLVLVFMAIFMVPIYLKTNLTTMSEYLNIRFGSGSQKYYSIIVIFLNIFLDVAGGIYAGVLVLSSFFPDVNLWLCSFVLAGIACAYTCTGGLKAVVYTDIIQTVVLIIGSTILTFFVFKESNYDWSALTAEMGENYLSLIRPNNDPQAPWLGTLIGMPVLGMWFWGINQTSMQRVLGAKNLYHARMGVLLGGALKLLPLFIMVIPGLLAAQLFPDLSNPDRVFPHLVLNLLPVGFVGLIIASLIAAIMSSLDSALNSTGTLLIYDFLLPDKKNYSPRSIKKVGQIVMLIVMIIAALWAPLIAHMGGIFVYFQKAFSILAPPFVSVFLIGLFTKRGEAYTGLATLILGHFIGIVFFILVSLDVWRLHYTIIAGINFFISCGLFFLLSYGLDEYKKEIKYKTRIEVLLTTPRQAWFMDYRLYASLIVLTVALLLIIFW